ncbi:MAG: hypothetical protein NXH78_00500 [Hyphomonadaceae bacterium]|nr:hypothetical protein [Hyphomonadaceae bacterium]
MIFAKPGNGFEWAVSEKAQRQLDTIFVHEPRLENYWNALRERLVQTGHREGKSIKIIEQANVFLFALPLDELPTIQVVYTILGITLTIQSVRTVG